jgi:hypothetical protein
MASRSNAENVVPPPVAPRAKPAVAAKPMAAAAAAAAAPGTRLFVPGAAGAAWRRVQVVAAEPLACWDGEAADTVAAVDLASGERLRLARAVVAAALNCSAEGAEHPDDLTSLTAVRGRVCARAKRRER